VKKKKVVIETEIYLRTTVILTPLCDRKNAYECAEGRKKRLKATRKENTLHALFAHNFAIISQAYIIYFSMHVL